MPSSSAFVATTPMRSPFSIPCSTARRSSGRYEPRYGRTRWASSASLRSSRLRTSRQTTSACRRVRTNTSVRASRFTSISSSADDVLPARMRIPSRSTGGFQNTKCFPPRGAPFSSIASTGLPVRRSASSPGLAMVAEQRMKTGSLP